jgi:acetylornithine deacetylase
LYLIKHSFGLKEVIKMSSVSLAHSYPLNDEARESILSAVDRAFDSQIQFTQKLVTYPSTRGNELSAQNLIFAAMRERGFEMDQWELDSEKLSTHPGAGVVEVSYKDVVNVVGTYGNHQDEGRSLILNGHIDVVPTGPEDQWSSSPWDAYIKDGWLYGRGSGDMKAGLVANLFAYDAIRTAGLMPTGKIHFESVVEEECTGNGTLSALLRGYDADAVLIPEPEEDRLVRANVGTIWMRVRVSGWPAHPREMAAGFNAIDASHHVMEQLRQLEAVWNAEKVKHRYFEDVEHPINLNLGKIEGGDWASTVPAWCELDLRLALYPTKTPHEIWATVMDTLDNIKQDANGHPITVSATKTGFFAEGYVLEEGTPAEQVLADSHRIAFAGKELQSFTTPGYLDGRIFVQYGKTPALTYGPVTEAIHSFDERVAIESIRRITKSIALFIAQWCGVKPAN